MKKVLTLVLVLCLALTAAACGGGGEESGGAAKDTLTWVQAADVTSLDPHVGKETPAVTVTSQIFDTLLTMDENNEPAPLLAESFEQLDERTYEFKLRQDVKFHDGEAMTADDVVFSLNRARESNYVSYVVDAISEVEKKDDYTVIVKTKEPYSPLLSALTVPFTAIVPQHAVEADEDAFALNPIGTGAYKFVEWKQGEYAKLEANSDYFQGAPKTQNLVMKVVPEASQRVIAIETGEADLAYNVSANDSKRVEEDENLQMFKGPSQSVSYLTINETNEKFADERVRQAIRYAIDKEAIVETMLYGAGEPADSVIPPSTFGFSAGFSCTLSVTDDSVKNEICQVIQSQLKEIGIEVSIQTKEFGTWLDELGTGSHELSFAGWVCVTGDADYTYYSLLHSTQTGYPGNDAFLKNKDVDKLVIAARETAEPEKRQEYYDQLEELLGDLSPYAPLYYESVNVGASKKVSGFAPDPNGYHRLRNVEVTE
ncbi:ABC transporter substrate-binding protein [Senimuribacter intestinalis]|uniref:ABC transporter substrate-binding protein n=1 Tax=Senimuribacter intestinalis TaxID=2941507 RepID=UPI00203B69DD|nr:ABC transporter substrate-binding protein [Senimuribacter intestinalis]